MKFMMTLCVLMFLSGCVRLHAPEHLVSDTYEVSKDIYHSITTDEVYETTPVPQSDKAAVKAPVQENSAVEHETQKVNDAPLAVIQEEPREEVKVFSASYAVPEDEALSISHEKCVNAAILQAKEALNRYRVDVIEKESTVSVNDADYVMHCSVTIRLDS